MSVPGPKAAMMLCDSAQVADGKLYVLGGGWSVMNIVDPSLPFFVNAAIDLAIPWDMGNRPIKVALEIVDEDGQPAEPQTPEGQLRVEGEIVAGRPPTARAGVPLHVPLVIPFPPIVGLTAGGYVVQLLIDGKPVESAQFQLVEHPQGGRVV